MPCPLLKKTYLCKKTCPHVLRATGEARGIEIGEEKTQLKTAEASLLEGLSIALTAKITGLPIEKVEEVARRLNL